MKINVKYSALRRTAGPGIFVLLLSAAPLFAQQPGSYAMSVTAGGGIDTGASVAAAKASISPQVVAAYDAAGNLFSAETGSIGVRIRKLGADGLLKVVSTASFLPTPASQNSPQSSAPGWSLAVRPDGTPLLAADSRKLSGPDLSGFYKILQMNSAGALVPVAGTGKMGFSGDNGPALSAQFSDISALTVDAGGNIYVADDGNARIRKIGSDGIVTTIAGTGVVGGSGDGGAATAAQIGPVSGLAVVAGSVYFSQPTLYKIRRIRPDGVVETFAGSGVSGIPKEGSDAKAGTLEKPTFVAGAPDGRVIFLDDASGVQGTRLRTVDATGKIWTVYKPEWLSDRSAPAGTCAKRTGQTSGSAPVRSLVSLPGGDLVIATGGFDGGTIVRLAPTPILVTVAGTLNAASYNDVLSPGLVFVIYGSGVGSDGLVTSAFDKNGLLPTSLGGTQILFDGLPAPLLYSSPGAVAGFVPFGAAASDICTVVQVRQGDKSSAPLAKLAFSSTPSIFSANASGTGQAVAANQDGSLNSPANPATRGSVLVFYATGGGVMAPRPQDGSQIVPPVLPKPEASVGVTIGDKQAEVLYAGAAPYLAAGILQVNARIPLDADTGSAVTLEMSVYPSGRSGQFVNGSVTVAVK